MSSPTEVGTPAAAVPVVVTISHQPDRVSQKSMAARILRDHLGVAGRRSVVRVVPLLRAFDVAGIEYVAAGNLRVVVSGPQKVAFEVFLHGLWAKPEASWCFAPLRSAEADDADSLSAATTALAAQLGRNLGAPAAGDDTDLEFLAARLAKDLADVSRNAVADLRETRYSLELELAETSTRSTAQGSQASVVSALLQLGIILGRVADSNRETVREGLWVHLTDRAAYHSHRVLQDPAIITVFEPATALTRSGMRLHDAAIRQCMELGRQVDAESVAVHALLSAAASVSSSCEADAQSSFNTLAAVASLGLGIPALVLALYGADRLLPLDTLPRQLAFLPVAAGLVFATVLAMRRSPRGEHRRVWIVGAAATLTALLGLLVVAGIIAPS
ncbi:hypothetical protein [Cryobacterium sp.]|jgi:hypothetical protein|uniref:hypothetical protein n=1 Tax=Cryobacterium sp. TaxID=1926290 RepID=UPI00262C8D97|nr:hypothetical protein [Cryobacterium sp.]MCU1445268.1 hypothetical protein [Cryobacterium sp.]